MASGDTSKPASRGHLKTGQLKARPALECPRHLRAAPCEVLLEAGMQAMPKALTLQERVRLLRLIASPQGADAPVYRSVPPSRDEFSADEEPLAWDAEIGRAHV